MSKKLAKVRMPAEREHTPAERRVQIQLAVAEYLRTARRYNEAAEYFDKACTELRGALHDDEVFVVRVHGADYMVSIDVRGDFHITEVETIV